MGKVRIEDDARPQDRATKRDERPRPAVRRQAKEPGLDRLQSVPSHFQFPTLLSGGISTQQAASAARALMERHQMVEAASTGHFQFAKITQNTLSRWNQKPIYITLSEPSLITNRGNDHQIDVGPP